MNVSDINYTLHKTHVKRLGNVLKEDPVTPPISRIMTAFKVINLISREGWCRVARCQVSAAMLVPHRVSSTHHMI